MISPINAVTKANISPVPKPPKAVNFTGLENFTATAQKASKNIFGFLGEKVIPFIEKQAKRIYDFVKDLKITEKINKYLPKVEENLEKAIKWVKDLKIGERITKNVNEFKNSNFAKEFGADLKNLYSKIFKS